MMTTNQKLKEDEKKEESKEGTKENDELINYYTFNHKFLRFKQF